MNVFTLRLDNEGSAGNLVLGKGCEALPDLIGDGVSESHARLFQRNGTWLVQDLGSARGTWLNGVEVFGAKPVRHGDVLRLSDVEVALEIVTESRETPRRGTKDALNGVVLDIRRLSVAVPGQVLLQDINVRACAGEFIGILGPSGCGKSTLIKAIAGLMPAEAGTIQLTGSSAHDLSSASAVAYLPQDVVIHEQLSVSEALGFISGFKAVDTFFSPDPAAVDVVIERVALRDRAQTRIASLSGGEKKRVGLAAELLGNPQVILLDEATSGLDPATEADQMELFRTLAESGKTVLCVTHNPARLALCHRVLFMASGRLLFDGSPRSLVDAMGVHSLDEAYRKATQCPVERLVADLSSKAGSANTARMEAESIVADGVVAGSAGKEFSWEALGLQTRLLVARYTQLLLADWRNLALVVGQAPAIAFLVVATFGNIKADFAELHAARLKELFLIQALAVLWCSGTASIREIVKEWPLLRHEQRYGLLPSGVLLSKFVMLGATAIVQAVLLTLITKTGCGVVGGWGAQLGVLSLLGCVGALQGLCISAVAGTSERAMTVLPVLLIGEAIISGGFAQLSGVIRMLAQVFNPAYWALDGLRSTLSTELMIATYPGAPGTFQPPILGLSGPLPLDVGMLVIHGTVLFGVTYVFFRAGLASRWITGLLDGLWGILGAAR